MIKCQINIAGEASRKVIGEPHRGVGGEEARKGREDTKPDKEMGRKGNRGSGGSSAERVPRSGYQHRLGGGHAWTLTGGGKVWALPQRNMHKRDCVSRVCPSTQAPDLHRSKQHRLCSADASQQPAHGPLRQHPPPCEASQTQGWGGDGGVSILLAGPPPCPTRAGPSPPTPILLCNSTGSTSETLWVRIQGTSIKWVVEGPAFKL